MKLKKTKAAVAGVALTIGEPLADVGIYVATKGRKIRHTYRRNKLDVLDALNEREERKAVEKAKADKQAKINENLARANSIAAELKAEGDMTAAAADQVARFLQDSLPK